MSAAVAPTLRADPLADDTIARILAHAGTPAAQMELIGVVNRQLAQWQTNGALATWRADAGTAAHVAAELEAYIAAGLRLPAWADSAQIARAETLFMDMSMMSCTLLFCASLPQCYVIPDLSAVLHAAGQLEQHADYRIRSTAAMLFPVMMKGGLTDAAGGGIAQTLKVRLIHATIRHLILRGAPAAALAGGARPLLAAQPPAGAGLHHALYAQGWDVAQRGLPCNQEELAYTLLTFHYVFLRGLRRLGIGLPPDDEAAYLHAWNVVGHVLGIERALMPESVAQAEAMFEQMQARGRADACSPDPRPALGAALMQVMENQIPFRLLKPFPVLMTRYLCGPDTARDLAINGRVSWLSRAAFALAMGLVRIIDTLARLVFPQFSLSRLVTRVAGYQFTVKVLMDQTRPLKLPTALLGQVHAVARSWHTDRQAPRWVNALEARLTGRSTPPTPEGERA